MLSGFLTILARARKAKSTASPYPKPAQTRKALREGGPFMPNRLEAQFTVTVNVVEAV